MNESHFVDRNVRAPFVIGLTGAIASGKSTVARMLREHGAHIIDADEVYRDLLRPQSALWQNVVARFGPVIVAPDGQIDRGALGGIVFQDPAALADLDALTHPAVVAEIRRRIADSRSDVVVVEAVKLARTDLLADVDALWLATADPEVRLSRVRERAGLDDADARTRIAASLNPLPDGMRADVVIDTSRDLAATERQVASAWQGLPRWLRSGKPVEWVSTGQEDH